MKYSVKQSGKWEIRATLSDKIKNLFSKIIANIKGGDEKYEDPKMFGSVDSVLNWELEGSVDISSEEMLQLVKTSKEADINYLEVLKKFGAMVKDGAKEVRILVQEELPEWRKILHENNMEEAVFEDEELRRSVDLAKARHADKIDS